MQWKWSYFFLVTHHPLKLNSWIKLPPKLFTNPEPHFSSLKVKLVQKMFQMCKKLIKKRPGNIIVGQTIFLPKQGMPNSGIAMTATHPASFSKNKSPSSALSHKLRSPGCSEWVYTESKVHAVYFISNAAKMRLVLIFLIFRVVAYFRCLAPQKIIVIA